MITIILFTLIISNSKQLFYVDSAPASDTSEKIEKREVCADRMNAISSNIAIKAAEEAKAAQFAQLPAACQAAHQVREQLAEKAMVAARAAQAAFMGKVALVEELIREKEAARMILLGEAHSKRQLQGAIAEELKALSEIKTLVNLISTGLNLAQTTAVNADRVLTGVREDLQQKNILLQQALRAVEILTRDEALARNDLDTTKCAARNALKAASEARANVLRNRRESELKFAALNQMSN